MNQLSPDQSAVQPDTSLRGRRLLIVRIFCIFYVVVEIIALVDSVIETIAQLRTPCISPCTDIQLSQNGVMVLQKVGISLQQYTAFPLLIILLSTIISYTVAAVLIWRKSDDWMALLVSLMLVSFSPDANSYGVRFSGWLSTEWAVHLSSLLAQFHLAILILVFFLFPSGRFVPRWTRYVFFLALGVSVYLIFVPLYSAPGWLNTVTGILYLAILFSLVYAQIYRYRIVSTTAQRLQTKWVVYCLTVVLLLGLSISYIPQIFFPQIDQPGSLFQSIKTILANGVLTFLPISFGVAILRYRLYDIDLIINRTLVYLTLSGVSALIYFGSIIAVQSLLGSFFNEYNSVTIVISTLVIAALFTPLRRRIQGVIDRHFFRKKYDAARTLEDFSSALRNEVNLDQLQEHLIQVIQESIQPAYISLWQGKSLSGSPKQDL